MPKYKLYELVPRRDQPGPCTSPHVWAVKLALASLGIEYKRHPMTYAQIRSELVELTGNPKVTVPTLEVDGKYITDSWVITDYLDKTYGLFRSEDEKRYARFLDYAKISFNDILRPLIMPEIYEKLEDDSKLYFRNTKIGPETLDSWSALASDDERFAHQCGLARTALVPLEKILSDHEYFGRQRNHADCIVFGAYAWARLSPRVLKETWEHDSLPNINRWIQRMLASGIVRKEDLA